MPHPGHWYPVRIKKGHLGKNLKSDGLKKYKKKNIKNKRTIIRERFKICFFIDEYSFIKNKRERFLF